MNDNNITYIDQMSKSSDTTPKHHIRGVEMQVELNIMRLIRRKSLQKKRAILLLLSDSI